MIRVTDPKTISLRALQGTERLELNPNEGTDMTKLAHAADPIDTLYQTYARSAYTPLPDVPYLELVLPEHPLADILDEAAMAIFDYSECHPDPEFDAALSQIFNDLSALSTALVGRINAARSKVQP